jgi:SAM-dependent methyltransferase
VHYDGIGVGYGGLRRPDPRIAAALHAALGEARRVVNVGAGTGSYEPAGCVAVEPSRVMLDQRPEGSAPAVQARAEALPFTDGTFDAAMAVLTTHHWTDPGRGLAELVRVSTRQVVLTWDQEVSASYWLIRDYLPEVARSEEHLPALGAVQAAWPDAQVRVVPVPWDCTDGFLAAYWRRPEAYLDPAVRAAVSSFHRLGDAVVLPAMARLAADLASGEWARCNADLLEQEELDCAYRLVVRC